MHIIRLRKVKRIDAFNLEEKIELLICFIMYALLRSSIFRDL